MVDAKNPARQIRRLNAVMSVFTWPLRLLGRGGGLKQDAETMDQWAEWAKAHVTASQRAMPLQASSES